jgi:hypothetical protein
MEIGQAVAIGEAKAASLEKQLHESRSEVARLTASVPQQHGSALVDLPEPAESPRATLLGASESLPPELSPHADRISPGTAKRRMERRAHSKHSFKTHRPISRELPGGVGGLDSSPAGTRQRKPRSDPVADAKAREERSRQRKLVQKQRRDKALAQHSASTASPVVLKQQRASTKKPLPLPVAVAATSRLVGAVCDGDGDDSGDGDGGGDNAERRTAVVRIQAAQRGQLARRELEQQRSAALHIQARQRGKTSRTDMQQQRSRAIKMQAMQRGRLARRELEQQRSAALHIQARQRGKTSRTDMQQQRAAAIQMQALQRGRVARAELAAQRRALRNSYPVAAATTVNEEDDEEEAYEDEFDEYGDDYEDESFDAGVVPGGESLDDGGSGEHAAAVKMQALRRGHNARAEMRRQHAAARRVQARQRGRRERRELSAQNSAALCIQARHRGKMGRKAMQQRRQHVLQPGTPGDIVGYDEDFDEGFDEDESVDVDDLWAQMESGTKAEETPSTGQGADEGSVDSLKAFPSIASINNPSQADALDDLKMEEIS